jgi:hypothetical protein
MMCIQYKYNLPIYCTIESWIQSYTVGLREAGGLDKITLEVAMMQPAAPGSN